MNPEEIGVIARFPRCGDFWTRVVRQIKKSKRFCARLTVVGIKIKHRMAGFGVSKNRKYIICLLLVLCAMFVFSIPTFGTDNNAPGHEVIILFDISTSMHENDPEFLAPDAMRQVISSLPSYWHIGIVTFNSDVVDAVPPQADSRESVLAVIDTIWYRLWTNSGAGMRRTVELFSEDALSRTIIYVTDGEMAALPTYQATVEATALAEEMMAQIIDSDITVHTISVGYGFERLHDGIMDFAPATGGYLFRDLISDEISDAAAALTFDALGAARHQIGAAKLTYSTGRFKIQLPNAKLDSVKVLIESESPIEDIVVNGSADSIEIQTGQRFTTVELLNPTDKNISIEFIARGSSNASIIAEWDLQLMADIADDGSVKLWLSDNAENNVLADPFFEGRFLPITINETQTQGRVYAGYINLGSGTLRDGEYLIQTSLNAFGINLPRAAEVRVSIPSSMFTGPDNAEVHGEEAAADEHDAAEQRNFVPMLIIILGIAVLVFCVFILLRRNQNESPQEPEEDEALNLEDFEGNFKFSGKLDIYTGENEEEQLPKKFEFGNEREASLQEILQKCSIPNEFSDAAKVSFTSKYGLLQLANNSKTTILVGLEKLSENQDRRLTYEESVTLYDDIGSKLVISPKFLYKARKKKQVKTFNPDEHN